MAASLGYKLEFARGFGLAQKRWEKTRSYCLSRETTLLTNKCKHVVWTAWEQDRQGIRRAWANELLT